MQGVFDSDGRLYFLASIVDAHLRIVIVISCRLISLVFSCRHSGWRL